MNGTFGLILSLLTILGLLVGSALITGVGFTLLAGLAGVVGVVSATLLVVGTLDGFAPVVSGLLTVEGVAVLSSLALAWLSLAKTGNNAAAANAGIRTYLILFFLIFNSYFKIKYLNKWLKLEKASYLRLYSRNDNQSSKFFSKIKKI